MKKRILAIVLGMVYMLSCMSFTSFAYIDEPREYVLTGEMAGLQNQHITPKTKNVFKMNTNTTGPLYVTSYNSDDDTTYDNQGIIIKYDISDIPQDTDRVIVNLATTKRNGMNYSNLINNNFKMGVYALDNLKDDWTTNQNWSDMIVEDIEISEFRKTKVATINGPDDIYEIKGSLPNTPVNGYGIEADVTDYIVSQKENNKEIINLLFIPESHGDNPSSHTTLTFTFESVVYQYDNKYVDCPKFRPSIRWYSIKKSEINTVESLTLENGYLTEEFEKDAVDSGAELEKTYLVGVKDETKPVELSYELSSIYSTVDGEVTEGMVGDTLILPVKSESGAVRTYKFELISMSEAGYTEDGKIVVEEFDYNDSTISAKLKNNSIDEKNAVIVVNEIKDKKLNKINVFDYNLEPGYSNIDNDFSKLSSTTAYSMYIADKENIFVPISSVIMSDSTSFDKKESVIEIYYKDATKEEMTVSGKWETGDTAIVTLVLNDGMKPSDYDGTNEAEVFNYAAATLTDADGYYGFDVAMPKSDDYTIYVSDSFGNVAELPIYYASVAEKELAFADVYSATSEDDLKEKLNIALTKEERKALEDKYNDTNGAEGQLDYVKLLALDAECFANGVSENSFVKVLYKAITEDTNTDLFFDKYNDAIIIAKINSGVVKDISEYDEKLSLSEDILEIYTNFSETGKNTVSANRISGNDFLTYDDIGDKTEEIILLTVFEEINNPDKLNNMLSTYSVKLGVDDYMSKYNKLVSSKKQKVINSVVAAAPYDSYEELEKVFEKAVNTQSKKETSGGGSSGGSSASGVTGMNQTIDISGAINTGSNKPVDEIYQRIYNFTDLTGFEWAENAVKYLFNKNVVNGVSESCYNPSGEVKREEFVKMISVFLENKNTTSNFTDVDYNAWYAPYINKAVASGVIKGINENEFGIGSGVTREDMAVMIYRVLNGVKVDNSEIFTDDSDISDYAKDAVYYLKSNNIVSGTGNGNYEPKRVMTRAEAAVILYNAFANVK